MKMIVVLLVLFVTTVEKGHTQVSPYLTTGISFSFGRGGYVYITPKITYGVMTVPVMHFINATISYSFGWSRDPFWSLYSEYGLAYVGVGAGVSMMKKGGIDLYSFRGNVFIGAVPFLNYTYHHKPEFPDNMGMEFVLPLRYNEDAFKL